MKTFVSREIVVYTGVALDAALDSGSLARAMSISRSRDSMWEAK